MLFALLLWRGLSIAKRAPDGLGSLLAAGLTLWITLEAFVNMASLLNLMPFAGNTLPFFSIGGSNLISTMAALGIVLNVSRLSEREQQNKLRRTFGAIVDLRGRDRRGRVSRSRRA
jgi:cell division protein FtsW